MIRLTDIALMQNVMNSLGRIKTMKVFVAATEFGIKHSSGKELFNNYRIYFRNGVAYLRLYGWPRNNHADTMMLNMLNQKRLTDSIHKEEFCGFELYDL